MSRVLAKRVLRQPAVFRVCLLFFCLSLISNTQAQGPQNVLVVINANSSDSLELANHYIAIRDIPPSNVVYLNRVRASKPSKFETINSKNFKEDILDPVLNAIRERELDQQIDCIAFSAGIPTQVAAPNLANKYLRATGEKKSFQRHCPFPSVTSLMFFGEDGFSDSTPVWSRDANGYAEIAGGSTRHFEGRLFWKNGRMSSQRDGKRYRLCSMLGVVREDGSSMEQAKQSLTNSVSADFTLPKGIFYFANHKDPRSRTRSSQFDAATKALGEIGMRFEVGEDRLPQKKKVVGAVLGSPKLDWKASGSQFVPGAFCDNFTSYGAFWTKNQTKLTHFINQGASGAVGMVQEPYTMPEKIPTAFAMVHYARGATLAESVYQTTRSPFLLLLVGDPICCPFGKQPTLMVTGIKNKSVVSNDINLSFETGAQDIRLEVFLDGKQLYRGKGTDSLVVPITDFATGFHEIRIAGTSVGDAGVTKTQKFEIFVRHPDSNQPEIRLKAKRTKLKIGQPLTLTASSNKKLAPQSMLEIHNNNRKIAETRLPLESFKIKTDKLGVGKAKLYGYVISNGERFNCLPLSVEITAAK